MILTFTVPDGPDRKVYTVLRRELNASAALVRRLKKTNGIRLNGEPVFTDRMIKPGDVLTADVSGCEPECDIVPENGDINIIYEDDGLIAVNKPAGIIVHPSHSRYTGTLSNAVSGYLLEKEGCPSVHAVNRLDRDTSGIVLFAKNSYMKARASDALSDDSAVKTYTAVICGELPADSGTINAPIKRVKEGDMLRAVSHDGQRAVTHYSRITSGSVDGYRLSLLSLELETGRTHQIRVHCAYMGCPILGDTLYKTEASENASRHFGVEQQLLHAVSLSFCHPVIGEMIKLTAPIIREDMSNLIANLL